MTDLDICAAQYVAIAGDLDANLDRHLRIMWLAARHDIEFLLFPELSLTGYELALAGELALSANAAQLEPLRELARRLRMTTLVGLPLLSDRGDSILIGSLLFGADGSQTIYTKQHLHAGEQQVFSVGTGGAALQIGEERIALSICADFTHASHVRAAAESGAGIYATSVLISEKGYPHDSELLSSHAREHSLGVLMANHGGPSGAWNSAGRSAFWAPGGRLVVSAAGTGDCLVIARRRRGDWQGHTEDLALDD
jgi:predicted amidohydrolase